MAFSFFSVAGFLFVLFVCYLVGIALYFVFLLITL